MESASTTHRKRPTRARNLLTGLLVLLILTGTGVVASRTLAAPTRSANAFLPADGSATAVWWQQGSHRSRAGVENALLYGADYEDAFAASLLRQAAPVPGRSPLQTDWWREVITASSFSDPSPRIRLRSVSDDGIRLHAQDWGTDGIVFDPAPIELPTDAAAGRTWTTRGKAVVNTAGLAPEASGKPERVDYQRRSEVFAPTDRARAAQGCLTVRSSTTLSSEKKQTSKKKETDSVWTEDELWCPGAGVVSSSGSFAGTDYRLAPDDQPAQPVSDAVLHSSSPEPSASWKPSALRFDRGDDTVGALDDDVDIDNPLSGRTATDQGCLLTVPGASGTDLLAGYPIGAGQTWMHGWLHPGGAITAVGTIGNLTVVGTDRRRLRSYDLHGRTRWTVDLPDITVVPPIPVGNHRLLVATVRGTVIMIDARTGATLWKRQVSGSINTTPISGSDYVVVATDSAVTMLAASDGSTRWSQDVNDAFALAGTDTIVTVLTYGTATGYRVSDGQDRWDHSTNDDLLTVLPAGNNAVVVSTSGLRAYDDRGRTAWQRRTGVDAVARAGDTILVADGPRVNQLAGDDGSVARHWSTAADHLLDPQLLVCGAGAMLVGRTNGYTLTGAWIGPSEDQQ